MPGPMPPAPPQGPPAPQGQGQPPQPGGDDSGGGALGRIMLSLDKAIDQVAEAITQSKGASDQEKQMITMVDQTFGKLMDSLGIGGGGSSPDADDGQGQGQTVPPEAGGNKGAIPSPM